jgi:hypothetical protein
MDLDRHVDQPVTLTGTARDARMGAVVLQPDRTPVYVAGLDEWPSDVEGEAIQATGVLRRRKLLADPVVGPDNARSDGLEGTSFVLEDAAWVLQA